MFHNTIVTAHNTIVTAQNSNLMYHNSIVIAHNTIVTNQMSAASAPHESPPGRRRAQATTRAAQRID